jgi:hypothetical protein
MRFRKLRIAWSVACGIAAVLLCMLWVRSYWQEDFVFLKILAIHSRAQLSMSEGRIHLLAHGDSVEPSGLSWQRNPIAMSAKHDVNWRLSAGASLDPNADRLFNISRLDLPNGILTGFAGQAPHWSIALLFAAFSIAPWLSRSLRFSLRTLLIATTLVALSLGLIVWLW